MKARLTFPNPVQSMTSSGISAIQSKTGSVRANKQSLDQVQLRYTLQHTCIVVLYCEFFFCGSPQNTAVLQLQVSILEAAMTSRLDRDEDESKERTKLL